MLGVDLKNTNNNSERSGSNVPDGRLVLIKISAETAKTSQIISCFEIRAFLLLPINSLCVNSVDGLARGVCGMSVWPLDQGLLDENNHDDCSNDAQ